MNRLDTLKEILVTQFNAVSNGDAHNDIFSLPDGTLFCVREMDALNIPATRKDIKAFLWPKQVARSINYLKHVCHEAASTWWIDPITGADLRPTFNVPEKLMLIVSEVAEAMEGYRKGLMDDKLPHRTMVEVELADVLIRTCDLAGAMGMDLGGAVAEKLAYNAQRADHKPENRLKEGGKAF